MHDEMVDPRDIRIEWKADTYRVYFWTPDGTASEEHELTGVSDVREVLTWAELNGRGQVSEVFIRHDHPPERGLIRISGGRPNVV